MGVDQRGALEDGAGALEQLRVGSRLRRASIGPGSGEGEEGKVQREGEGEGGRGSWHGGRHLGMDAHVAVTSNP